MSCASAGVAAARARASTAEVGFIGLSGSVVGGWGCAEGRRARPRRRGGRGEGGGGPCPAGGGGGGGGGGGQAGQGWASRGSRVGWWGGGGGGFDGSRSVMTPAATPAGDETRPLAR